MRRKHPWQWAAAIVLVLIVFLALRSLATNPNVDLPTIVKYLFDPLTLSGLGVTLALTVVSMVLGLAGGMVLAVMRLSGNVVLATMSRLYVWAFRAVPVLVQLIFWAYLGALYAHITIGIPFTDIVLFSARTSDVIGGTTAAILALGLSEMAYCAEIVRGGMLAIDRGQIEAAHSLAMSPGLTMRRIVLPQAMRVIVPPLGNETINMVKLTSLVSVIAGADLMTRLQTVYSQNFKVIPLLLVGSIWYLILITLLSFPQAWLERRYGRGVTAQRSPSWRSIVAWHHRRHAKRLKGATS
ncbi:amino acid ABC transporter permease [Microbacterium capsulatum]|uniref:Amino acid ABC transporter permease n=1 Tax=Microbacterium capsulatum TaxID=3041921 RepID=A0ABU0XBR5_9MICO|nr:amino acid ABC transporter permease [Microbacterium sp. ASV81]MDQ4212545.1 amino acid ABC transporter permease [Microbacterium sp. ASV81]